MSQLSEKDGIPLNRWTPNGNATPGRIERCPTPCDQWGGNSDAVVVDGKWAGEASAMPYWNELLAYLSTQSYGRSAWCAKSLLEVWAQRAFEETNDHSHRDAIHALIAVIFGGVDPSEIREMLDEGQCDEANSACRGDVATALMVGATPLNGVHTASWRAASWTAQK